VIYFRRGACPYPDIKSTIVSASSAWTGLEEEATVDEVEAVRTFSGELPGLITPLTREHAKPDGNSGTRRSQ